MKQLGIRIYKMVDGKVYTSSVEKESKNLKFLSSSNPHVLLELETKKEQKMFGKLAKKSRLSQLEVCINKTEAKEVGSSNLKGIAIVKTQISRPKTNIVGKRGDRRDGKVPTSKYDSFSVKSGLTSFSSAALGNDILGGYGLRPGMEDVTEHVDELSLDKLLEGDYKCPIFAKDKGKKLADPNEKIMQFVIDAWSVLQTRNIKPQIVELDGSYHQDVLSPICLTTDSLVAARNEEANVDTNMTDVSPACKGSGLQFKASSNILDFPLYEPKKILERLTLPPSKDLEFLLLDVAKPSAASRNSTDQRPAKPANQRGCLPPFSWSNTYSGHCKSLVDAVKVSTTTSRSACQGRWAKIETSITSPDTTSGFLTDLESHGYDNSIVPAECRTLVPVVNQKDRSESVKFSEQGLSTLPGDPRDSQDVCSPRALAAAQLLVDMTARFESLKRPSQKSIRAPYSKPDMKPENVFSTPKSKSRFNSSANSHEIVFSLKRPRLSVNEKSTEIVYNKIIPRGQLPSWSMSRSSRSSSNKALMGSSFSEIRKSFMLPLAARTMEPASSSRPKPRKLMRIGWNKETGKLDGKI